MPLGDGRRDQARRQREDGTQLKQGKKKKKRMKGQHISDCAHAWKPIKLARAVSANR
jgi:hypothetical protein